MSENLERSKRTLKNFFLDVFLLLMLSCLIIMFLLVAAGNPLLPVQSLANSGLGFHHIAEISGFFFFGMWLGILPTFYSKTFSWADPVAFLFVIALTYLIAQMIQPPEVAIKLAVVPSAFGFIVRRGIMIKRKS